MTEEGSKTTLHRGFTESIKKHTEDNEAHRKYRHSEGDGYSLKRGKCRAGKLHWGWLKSDQTCTQANTLLLAVFPLTTARDRRWWSHCPSLGSPCLSTSTVSRYAFHLPSDPYLMQIASVFCEFSFIQCISIRFDWVQLWRFDWVQVSHLSAIMMWRGFHDLITQQFSMIFSDGYYFWDDTKWNNVSAIPTIPTKRTFL